MDSEIKVTPEVNQMIESILSDKKAFEEIHKSQNSAVSLIERIMREVTSYSCYSSNRTYEAFFHGHKLRIEKKVTSSQINSNPFAILFGLSPVNTEEAKKTTYTLSIAAERGGYVSSGLTYSDECEGPISELLPILFNVAKTLFEREEEAKLLRL